MTTLLAPQSPTIAGAIAVGAVVLFILITFAGGRR